MANNTTSTDESVILYSRFWELFHCGFLILVNIGALIGNGFVCTAVYRVRRLQKVANYFLVSLAVSDLLVASLATPFRIYFEINTKWCLGEHVCKFWIIIDLLCNTASIVNLSLISVDRYLALSLSLRYTTIVTVSKCRIAIAAVWGFSFGIAASSLHTWSRHGQFVYHRVCQKMDKLYYTISTVLGILVPTIVLTVLYCLVFKIAFQQQTKILKNNYNTPRSSVDGLALQPPHATPASKRRKLAIRELKATKTLIIVVGAFLVCWLPVLVLLVMQQYAPGYTESLPLKTQEILGLLILYSLPPLTTCLNPFIYTCHNAEFRKVFKMTFAKLLPFLKIQSSKNEKHIGSPDSESDFVSTPF